MVKKNIQFKKIDTFDISDNNFDLNKSNWKIKNYDLVLCFRTTQYANNKELFLQELKKVVNFNKFVIIQFTLYSGIIFYKNKPYIDYFCSEPRMPPGNLVFDTRNLLKVSFIIKSFLFIRKSYKFFYGKVVGPVFNITDLLNYKIEPKKIIIKYNSTKGDISTYCIWSK